MKTLYEMTTQGGIDQLEALDIALQLCYRIEDNAHPIHLDPHHIRVDADNIVTVTAENGAVDCLYAPADVILDGAPPSQAAMRFSLGCLLYFMLNGRSYYDACGLDPFEVSETRQGNGLVDPNVYSGRAWEAICAFTSWDPEKRSEGMVELVKVLEHVPAQVTLRYICNGRVIHSEQMDIQEDMGDFRSGERIEGSDHATYTVLPGANIRYRPGYHNVDIPVSAGAASNHPQMTDPGLRNPFPPEPPAGQAATWLVVRFPNPSSPDQLIFKKISPIAEAGWTKRLPVSLLAQTRYQFIAVDVDATGSIVGQKNLFHLDIPADSYRKRAFLAIVYHTQPKGFSVVLGDERGNPVANALHFQLK